MAAGAAPAVSSLAALRARPATEANDAAAREGGGSSGSASDDFKRAFAGGDLQAITASITASVIAAVESRLAASPHATLASLPAAGPKRGAGGANRTRQSLFERTAASVGVTRGENKAPATESKSIACAIAAAEDDVAIVLDDDDDDDATWAVNDAAVAATNAAASQGAYMLGVARSNGGSFVAYGRHRQWKTESNRRQFHTIARGLDMIVGNHGDGATYFDYFELFACRIQALILNDDGHD